MNIGGDLDEILIFYKKYTRRDKRDHEEVIL